MWLFSYKKLVKLFLVKLQPNNSKIRAWNFNCCIYVTEEYLEILEGSSSSAEVAIDALKLKLYNTQLKMWDYAKVSAGDFQNLWFHNRSYIFKKYYVDISTKYSVGPGKMFVFFFGLTLAFLGLFLRLQKSEPCFNDQGCNQ